MSAAGPPAVDNEGARPLGGGGAERRIGGGPLVVRRLDSTAPDFDRELAALTTFEAAQDPTVDATVARIIADVRSRGDDALLEYTVRWARRSDTARVSILRSIPARVTSVTPTMISQPNARQHGTPPMIWSSPTERCSPSVVRPCASRCGPKR